MPKAQILKKGKKKNGTSPRPKIELPSLFSAFTIISTSGQVHSRGTKQEQIPLLCPYKQNPHKYLTNTQISWQSGMFAHLLCQQKVYLSIRKDSCICNKPIAFDTQLITSVSYYLLCMIAVLMKLFWCGNETGQDKQIRKLKGFWGHIEGQCVESHRT